MLLYISIYTIMRIMGSVKGMTPAYYGFNRIEKQHFLQVLESGTDGVYSHAYIIEGAYGTGKTDFVLFCASAILCSGVERPCGICNSCKKAASLSHPDIHFYGGESGKAITMREVRELISSSILMPNDGDKKIYIIKAAHKMRPDTQNALLKILEEPPESVIVFLLTEKKEAMLPTILSRCRVITLRGESDEKVQEYLQNKYKTASREEVLTAVRASGGSIGQAELLMSREKLDERKKAFDIMDTLFEGTKSDFIKMIASEKLTRDKLLELIELLERMFADLLGYKYKSHPLVLLSGEDAQRYGSSVTKRAISLMGDAVTSCRSSIEQSGNINAAVTNLCIRLWELKG
ncbi:MAG TPA: hypothetical protein DD733_01980 [Clostridiales bacterium]|nr:hypothetical protein [Clostridiales bacterium]